MALRPDLRWNCWPDDESHLLLQAVLHRDDAVALGAWRRFVPRLDLGAPNDDQWRLLGHMSRRLASLDPDDPTLPSLQRVARRIAVENLAFLAATDSVLDRLDGAGFEPVVLKGTALLLSVYESSSMRPIRDVDLLVAPDRHDDLIEFLESAGWTVDSVDHLGNHAIGMIGGPVSVDVHRALNLELVAPGVPDNGWGTFAVVDSPRALPSGRRVRMLAPTDALLHTIVHGLQCFSPVTLRWVDDAVQLLRSGEVDGDRLCMLAERFAVAPVVHDALLYVDDVTGGTVDPAVLRRLAAIPTSRLDDVRLRAFHERTDTAAASPPLRYVVSIFLQRSKGYRPVEWVGLVPRSLLQQFEVDGWWEFVRKVVGLASVRTGRRLARVVGD